MSKIQEAKKLVLEYYNELENASAKQTAEVLKKYTGKEYNFKGSYPLREQSNVQDVVDKFWTPIKESLGSMQRRMDIFMAGDNEMEEEEEIWVMSMGNFMGNFVKDWLGVRCTNKLINLRYCEFSCVKEGKIIKTGLFYDMIGFMVHAGANPLPPQVGSSFVYPGPREHNGLLYEAMHKEEGEKTLNLVKSMMNQTNPYEDVLDCMPHEDLAKNWAEDMLWCGSAGAGYTIPVFQEHQKDFRRNLVGRKFNGHIVRFAEGNFCCFFGWPNLINTPTGGYLGMIGGEKEAEMQVVDIYYRKGDKLAENWVFPDIPYWAHQLGLEIFDRTKSILNP